MEDSKIMSILVEVKVAVSSLTPKVEAAIERINRMEEQMTNVYATKEGLRRIEDKIDSMTKDNQDFASHESLTSLTYRLNKAEETLTWAIRGIITAFGGVAVTAIIYAVKHGA